MNCRGKIRVDTANVKTLRHDATEYLDSAICIYLCDSMWPISGAHQFREESWTDDRDLVTDLIRMGNTRFVFLGVRSIYADLFVVADGLPIRLKGNIEEHVTPKNQLTGSGVKSRIVRAANSPGSRGKEIIPGLFNRDSISNALRAQHFAQYLVNTFEDRIGLRVITHGMCRFKPVVIAHSL